MRFAGIASAYVVGIGVPAFLLGPAMSHDVPWNAISTPAIVGSVVCGMFGIWLFVVSCLAQVEDVRKALEPLQASEAALLFLPYMLIAGSTSVWRQPKKSNGIRHEEP